MRDQTQTAYHPECHKDKQAQEKRGQQQQEEVDILKSDNSIEDGADKNGVEGDLVMLETKVEKMEVDSEQPVLEMSDSKAAEQVKVEDGVKKEEVNDSDNTNAVKKSNDDDVEMLDVKPKIEPEQDGGQPTAVEIKMEDTKTATSIKSEKESADVVKQEVKQEGDGTVESADVVKQEVKQEGDGT